MGAPKIPCPIRKSIKVSKFGATAHKKELIVKPRTVPNIRVRQPNRPASQPVNGVATAAATRFNVIDQDASS